MNCIDEPPVVIAADPDLDAHGNSPADTLIDFSEFEGALRAATVHFWPDDRAFRKSGASNPQVGDVAACGAVKTGTSAWGQRYIGAPLTCAECAGRRR